MTARNASAKAPTTTRKARAPKPAAAPKASTAVAVIEPEDVVLEGTIVDDAPASETTKKARIDHSTHAHASSKAARATCRANLKKAAAAADNA